MSRVSSSTFHLAGLRVIGGCRDGVGHAIEHDDMALGMAAGVGINPLRCTRQRIIISDGHAAVNAGLLFFVSQCVGNGCGGRTERVVSNRSAVYFDSVKFAASSNPLVVGSIFPIIASASS